MYIMEAPEMALVGLGMFSVSILVSPADDTEGTLHEKDVRPFVLGRCTECQCG